MKSGRPRFPPLNRNTTEARRELGKFRSRSEKRAADQLRALNIKYRFERTRVEYVKPKGTVICPNCGPVSGQLKKYYLPDFELSNGVFIEVKGRFTSADRIKLKTVKKQHPNMVLCLLFDSDRLLESRRPGVQRPRYGEWANANGIPWAVKIIPDAWLRGAEKKLPNGTKTKIVHLDGSKSFPDLKRKRR